MTGDRPAIAVVGHVEWVEFLRVDHLPRAGELQAGEREPPRAGGSAVIAASVIAARGASVRFIGAVGDDAEGEAALAQLRDRGITVDAVRRAGPTRRVTVLLDQAGERAIITSGERWAPAATDDLGWERLEQADGVYLTAGDGDVLALARRARVLVATPRIATTPDLPEIELDALVFSAGDQREADLAQALAGSARLLVATEGRDGGHWRGETEGRWGPAPIPGRVRDSYGCGDAFAGGFTLGLARGGTVAEAAALGAACGAEMLTHAGAP
jgi:ribokinase